MILQNNPHLLRRNELYALISKESNPEKVKRYEAELADVERKSREFTAKAIALVQVKAQEIREQKSEVLAVPKYIKGDFIAVPAFSSYKNKLKDKLDKIENIEKK